MRFSKSAFVAVPAYFKDKLARVSPIGVCLTKRRKLYHHGAGLQAAVKAGHYGDFDSDIAAAVLE